jgi:hypothetical protein
MYSLSEKLWSEKELLNDFVNTAPQGFVSYSKVETIKSSGGLYEVKTINTKLNGYVDAVTILRNRIVEYVRIHGMHALEFNVLINICSDLREDKSIPLLGNTLCIVEKV